MPNQLLERVNFSEPGIWFFFLTVLVLVLYWYFHESADLRREYARFYRELSKEEFFKVAPAGWPEKFRRATVLFDGGGWFAAAWAILLILACGLVFLQGAQSDNIRRVIAFAPSQSYADNLRADLTARAPAEVSNHCDIYLKEQATDMLRKISAELVLQDAPKQGDSLQQIIEKLWPKPKEDSATQPKSEAGPEMLNYLDAPSELRRRKADFVLEQTVERVFRLRTACVNCEGRTLEDSRNTIIACIYSGWQRQTAQQGIGAFYLLLAVAMVICIKGRKSAAFALMQSFSAQAMEARAATLGKSAAAGSAPVSGATAAPAVLAATKPATPPARVPPSTSGGKSKKNRKRR